LAINFGGRRPKPFTSAVIWLAGVTGYRSPPPMPSTYYVMGANVAMAIAILLVPNADTDHGQWLPRSVACMEALVIFSRIHA
jgi:hypothetical protein